MATDTKIQWTDHTASPWHGCTHGIYTDADGNEHEHPGCAHCYAETMSKRNPATLGVWGKEGTRVMSASFAEKCRRWNKLAERDGVIRSVFPSICDPFENWQGPILDAKWMRLYRTAGGRIESSVFKMVGPKTTKEFEEAFDWVSMDDLRRDLFATIDACPHLRFLLLTKRPGNVRRMWPVVNGEPDDVFDGYFRRNNVAILTSISDQATADAMIPELLKCRDLVPILGVSAEPLLGPIDLTRWLHGEEEHGIGRTAGACVKWTPSIDWVIVGGESGKGARPFDLDWGNSIIQQCKIAGVPVFMKQVGSNPIFGEGGHTARGITTSVWGPIKDSKGGVMEEWPLNIRVREFPKASVPA